MFYCLLSLLLTPNLFAEPGRCEFGVKTLNDGHANCSDPAKSYPDCHLLKDIEKMVADNCNAEGLRLLRGADGYYRADQ